jgi:hypothetical protein
MVYQFIFACCLIIFFEHAQAQEETLNIDLIELLGELDDSEISLLEKTMTDIETASPNETQQAKDLGVVHEESVQ